MIYVAFTSSFPRRALRYRLKYLTDIRYDNFYVNEKFQQIDKTRVERQMEALLPLTWREKRVYVRLDSFMLGRKEWKSFIAFTSSIFLVLSCAHIGGILLADYSLFWFLNEIAIYGGSQDNATRQQQKEGKSSWRFTASFKASLIRTAEMISFDIHGSGVVADLAREFAAIIKPFAVFKDFDPAECLPKPRQPNYGDYHRIAALMLFAWLLLLGEPYILRLRQTIMQQFYPDRSLQRTVWLYFHIMRKRTSFLTFARRQARRRFLKDDTFGTSFSCLESFRAKVDGIWICRKMFGVNSSRMCMLCGATSGR